MTSSGDSMYDHEWKVASQGRVKVHLQCSSPFLALSVAVPPRISLPFPVLSFSGGLQMDPLKMIPKDVSACEWFRVSIALSVRTGVQHDLGLGRMGLANVSCELSIVLITFPTILTGAWF